MRQIAPLLLPALLLGLPSPAAGQYTQGSQRPAAQAADTTGRGALLAIMKADQEQVALARAALPSLQDSAVKRLAQQVIDAHGPHFTTTKGIATRLQHPVPPDAAAPAATARQTDAQYIAAMVTGHEQLLAQLPTNVTGVQDQGLREHIASTRQTIQSHLDEARRLQTKFSSTPAP